MDGIDGKIDRLRSQKATLEAVLDSAADGICALDEQGAIILANPAAASMLGWQREELIGRRLVGLLAAEVPEGDPAPVESTLRAGRDEHGELEHVHRRDGKELWLEYRSRPLVIGERVAGAVVSLIDISERKRLEAELQRQADRDSLTDLLNRRAFERELARELAFTTRYRTPTAVMVLDVDGLKTVNDVHGHPAGDELLRSVALVLRSRLRRTDTAGRLGGDEFGVILPRSGEDPATTVAEEILAVLRMHKLAPGGPDHLTVSIGVAVALVGGLTPHDVMRSADRAMYKSKQAGGDRLSVVTTNTKTPGSAGTV